MNLLMSTKRGHCSEKKITGRNFLMQLAVTYVALFFICLRELRLMKASVEGLSLLEMMDDNRKRFGSSPAVEVDVCCLTHDQLHERANRFASDLAKLDLQAGSVIGIYMDACVDYVVTMLGTLKAGMVFMPLNTEFPPKQLNSILDKTLPVLLVTDQAFSVDLHRKLMTAENLSQCQIDMLVYPPSELDFQRLIRAREKPAPDASLSDSMLDACYIFTTSGSTGVPKAILGSYRSLSHFIRWETQEFSFDNSTRGSLLSPVTFDVSLRDIFVPLAVGGCVCIPSKKTIRDPASLFQWMHNNKITLTHIVPTLFRLLIKSLGEQQGKPPLPDLKHILLAGESSYGSDIEKWRQAAGSNAQIVNLYGPSETTLAKLFCRIEDGAVALDEILPIGQPIPDTKVMILSDGCACGVGEPGEIYIGTTYRSKGYYRDPELNAKHFVVNPMTLEPSDIFYKTGDQGEFLADGKVKYLGRLDGQVKLHGKRTDLGEIETVLRQYAGIRQAAVAVKNGSQGSRQLLVGYIVPERDVLLSLENMRSFLKEKLPDYMVPQVFTYLDTLPLTHSGKVDRNALPDPSRKRPRLSVPYVPPKNEEEIILCTIWSEVLEIDLVGTRDGFFDLGGSSVLGMSVVERVRSELSVNMPVVKLYEYPNVALLANYIRNVSDEGTVFTGLNERASRRRAKISSRKNKD